MRTKRPRHSPSQRVHAGDRTKTGTPFNWALVEGALADGDDDADGFSSLPSQSDVWCPPTAAQAPGQRSPTTDATAARPVSRRPWPAAAGRPRHGPLRHPSWRVPQRPSQYAPTAGAGTRPGRDPEAQAGGGGAMRRGPVSATAGHAPATAGAGPPPLSRLFATGVSSGPRRAARGGPSGVSPASSPPPRKAVSPPQTDNPPCPQAGLWARRRRRMKSRQCTLAAFHRCGSTIYYQRR